MPDYITISVRVYGILRDRLSADSSGVISLQLPVEARIHDVINHLELSGHLQIVLDNEIVDDFDQKLSDHNALDIFLPTAGGK